MLLLGEGLFGCGPVLVLVFGAIFSLLLVLLTPNPSFLANRKGRPPGGQCFYVWVHGAAQAPIFYTVFHRMQV